MQSSSSSGRFLDLVVVLAGIQIPPSSPASPHASAALGAEGFVATAPLGRGALLPEVHAVAVLGLGAVCFAAGPPTGHAASIISRKESRR